MIDLALWLAYLGGYLLSFRPVFRWVLGDTKDPDWIDVGGILLTTLMATIFWPAMVLPRLLARLSNPAAVMSALAGESREQKVARREERIRERERHIRERERHIRELERDLGV